MQFYNQIEIEEMLSRAQDFAVFDVRTAVEYLEGAVPGSINIPLFNEAERARIGSVYLKNPLAAKYLAMDIVSPNISKFVRRINGCRQGKPPVILCWRGGMRSRVTVEFLHMVGIEALQLQGGYRRYRQYIHTLLTEYKLDSQVIVVKGKSGTGKTDILNDLAERGYPVLDLEGLAAHRGSTFGSYEQACPSTQKNFDASLLQELQRLRGSKLIMVEGESKRIGNIYVPDFLFTAMKEAPVIEVEGSLDARVERIVRDYAPKSHQARLNMYRALARLRHRLAKTALAEMKHCLDAENYNSFVRLILTRHYDNIYDHQLPGVEVLARVNSDNTKKAADEIAALISSVNSYSD